MDIKKVLTILTISSSILQLQAKTIDFLGTKSVSSDQNMIKVTTDLIYSQWNGIDGWTVKDRREVTYRDGLSTDSDFLFWTEIQETPEGEWLCTFNARESKSGKTSIVSKSFPTYYKILMESKTYISDFATNLSNGIFTSVAIPRENKTTAPETAEIPQNVEDLAGTWTGEEEIDKIMILRGGRGFVIFRNGSSMNIEVSISADKVIVRQNARFNASFYPDLPRSVALSNAEKATPIQWTMSLSGNTLSGIKTTLRHDESSATGASNAEIPVSWTKIY